MLRAIVNRIYRLIQFVAGKIQLLLSRVEVLGRVQLARGVRLRVTNGAMLRMANGVVIDRFADITVKYGHLEIGARTYVGQFSVICARDSVVIGSDCLIAEHVSIRDQNHRFGAGLITAEAGFSTGPITIGNNVWIGAKATITKGVSIGQNSVIGANAVVTRDIPENCIAAGAPARVIRRLESSGEDSACH